ncbi:unnamed protein product (macronuclear) [Paramecium tetraurelia]|uniref:Uncharacterized protein n=1 Tax=Paramecium tetraurelia TaxID=5888 RepID=A0CZH0_PARTE|nr:uncharacterized protein GSPATT00011760001 [Paramecium tetraurelia]CAK76187.1 unnamed protein product [Paramecium tetraurelia]|eukprot:XP_001443584.1 hypothetical protein (macronuclear) [Paramecium tetraurelia strain d4-2]
MHNQIIHSSFAICKTDDEEFFGSKAQEILKEKMKIFELDKIPYMGQQQKKKTPDKQRNKSQQYQNNSKVTQPSSYSQYRISNKENKEQIMSSQNRVSKQILESIKRKQSGHEPKLIDIPIVRVSREQALSSKIESQNNISLILMEKYYQAAMKYEEKNQRQTTKVNLTKNTSKLIINNQAVKNLQRKIKNSRRELSKELNTSTKNQQTKEQLNSVTPVGSNKYFAPFKSILIRGNYSTDN